MNEIVLSGCTPTPLASYLKALAVLRLVAEQGGDSNATGYWRNDVFVLRTELDRDALLKFFLERYCPTPIISPWSGRAGFLEGEDFDDSKRKGAVAVLQIKNSKGARFSKYRDVFKLLTSLPEIQRLNRARTELKRLDKNKKHKKSEDDEQVKSLKSEQEAAKTVLIPLLRYRLPETCLGWIDTCFAVGATTEPAPFFGTGGNEGSMDYSVNHVLNLIALIDLDNDHPANQANDSLEEALFSGSVSTPKGANLGFLAPSSTGGTNMSSGFNGPTAENPWNAVLTMEGALFLAASVVRRHESSAKPAISAPFFFAAVRGGHSAGAIEEKTRPEFWAPLWNRPVTLIELSALFDEGRVVIGHRNATNGLDAARAIASYGVARGIRQFQRYAMVERRGRGYFVAAPMHRVTALRNRSVDLLVDLDRNDWLSRVQGFMRDDKAPNAFRALAMQLNAALLALTQREKDQSVIERLLRLLGRIEASATTSTKTREQIAPVPPLSPDWALYADDDSAEFRIAQALAGLSLRGEREGKPIRLGLRPHLAPLATSNGGWGENRHLLCWAPGPLERNLAALLHRRRLEAVRLGTEGEVLASRTGATLDDVIRLLMGETDDRRISELAHGLACVERLDTEPPQGRTEVGLSSAYLLLKPFFTSESRLRRLGWLPEDRSLRLPTEIPARLAADDVVAALRIAWQRLRVLDKKLPGPTPPDYPSCNDGPRLLAALMIPLVLGETRHLLNQIGFESRAQSDSHPETTS